MKKNGEPNENTKLFQRFIEKDCNKKIKSIRMAYGMTTYALGNLIGCTGEAVCRWERGICTPELKYFKTIERIAKEKGITIAELNETPELIGDDYELFCNSGYSKVKGSVSNPKASINKYNVDVSPQMGVWTNDYNKVVDPQNWRDSNYNRVKPLNHGGGK